MRIAHCSDPHLLSLRGARIAHFANKRWLGGLDLVAGRARTHQARVFEAMVADFIRSALDHVVVTGDITNVALAEEFRYARRLFDAIDLGPDRVTVLPGNHDAYVSSGVADFAAHFAGYSTSDRDWNRPVGEPCEATWPVVRLRGPLAVIALSTSIATPWFAAWGRLGERQLSRLATILADPRLAHRFRLVAIHHPPAGEGSASPRRGLRDRAGFAAAVAAAGAELVLHGHDHRDRRATLATPDGAVAVRGIQSASHAVGGPDRLAHYRVYEISDTAGPGGRPELLGESLRGWDPRREKFVTRPPGAGS
jgi:3',5'-cyclic AMP phosphodiesterase CpdA